MVDWLNIPEVEQHIKAADAEPASVPCVWELSLILAGALGRKLTTKLSFEGRRLDFSVDGSEEAGRKSCGWSGWVEISDREYVLCRPAGNDLIVYRTESTEKIVWRICTNNCTPAEWRSAEMRAKREGMKHPPGMIPIAAFIDEEERRSWQKRN